MTAKPKNTSEILFEGYLRSQGFDWRYEPVVPGQSKRPDYELKYKGQLVYFEVKERREKRPMSSGAVHTDPFASLRSEINKAHPQFKALKAYPCALVVHNIADWEASLDPPDVFGAMLGNPGVVMEFDPPKGRLLQETMQGAFLDGGKMLYKRSARQNTTFSAIVVLEDFEVKDPMFLREFDDEIKRREAERGVTVSPNEFIDVRIEMQKRYPRYEWKVPRVVVIENPVARVRFPDGLFAGEYDERWALERKGNRALLQRVSPPRTS